MRSFWNKVFAIAGLLILSMNIVNGVHYAISIEWFMIYSISGSWLFVSSILDEIKK